MLDLEKAFWSKVEKTSSCWIWTGTVRPDGYGQFRYKGFCDGAHRVAYFLSKSTILIGMHVLHQCDIPLCVNPDHLFLGTAKDNIDDCIRKKRFRTGSFHRDAKLKDEDVEFIRKAYESKLMSQGQLAKQFQVSQPTIHEIVHNLRWKHGSNKGVEV